MTATLLNQIDLARRWRISPRTLERWRWLRKGPPFMRIGGAIRYRIEDVETFEAAQRREMPQDEILGNWR